ncbi:MAG TPA: hypothetical protein VGD67_27335 [Pseudonocardiaceae bacterium]
MSERDPHFLSAAGEQGWARLRRHLNRADRFWLAVVLTEDTRAADTLVERITANRRLRAERCVVLRPGDPEALAGLVETFEEAAAPPPGCTVVLPRLAVTPEWEAGWRSLLYLLNHRRDVFRRAVGGIVLIAPPGVKPIAQREATDLWSILDLLVELPTEARPALRRDGPRADQPVRVDVSALDLGEADDDLVDEANRLLELPRDELAGRHRTRTTTTIGDALARDATQLAAVLLLAQADGHQLNGDGAAALDLVRRALSLPGIAEPTRIRLLDTAAELARDVSDLDEAAAHAAESVELKRGRTSRPGDADALRDLAVSLTALADLEQERGNLDTATTGHTEALTINRRLAEQLGTPEALSNLAYSITKFADLEQERGNLDTATAGHTEALTIDRRLAEQLGTPDALSNLATSLERFAELEQERGNLDTATAGHTEALTIRRRLAEQLGTPLALRDLSISLGRVADLEQQRGNLDTATAGHTEALTIRRRLAEQLGTPDALRDLRYTLRRLAELEALRGNEERAAALRAEAEDVTAQLERITP